jgi:hypothetical protein
VFVGKRLEARYVEGFPHHSSSPPQDLGYKDIKEKRISVCLIFPPRDGRGTKSSHP